MKQRAAFLVLKAEEKAIPDFLAGQNLI